MKLHKLSVQNFVLRSSILAATCSLLFFSGPASAQTTPAAAQPAQPQSAAPILPNLRILPRVTQAVDNANRVTLKGNVHPLARPEFDQGAVPDAQPMNRMLLLLQRNPEQEIALRQFLDQQQDKTSANYHAWLTPAQFGAQFGPVDADVQATTDWLRSQGFQNIKVSPGKLTVEFSGTAGQVRNAFQTEIHKFAVNGDERQANTTDPQIPSALKPVLTGIVSLHNFPKKSLRRTFGTFRRSADGTVTPEFTVTNSTGAFFAMGPADFARIYNIPVPLVGTGSTVAIIGTSNINLQDVRDFRTLFGLPANDPTIILNGPDPGIAGEEGEADLDVEWAGAVAPAATIDFVVSEDTLSSAGIDLSSIFVIDNNLADVMSLSFGSCEANLGTGGTAFYSGLWEQAAAQGITVTVSTGDGGSAGCDNFNTAATASQGLAVSGIASTEFNIAVGGTDFDDAGRQQPTFWNTTNGAGKLSALGYIPETTWNLSCAATATAGNLATCGAGTSASLLNIVGGSGGPSAVNPKPLWQNGATPVDGFRDTPDVSLFASEGSQSKSFYVVCQADSVPAGSSPSCAPTGSLSFEAVGGTSASAPTFAAIMALIKQSTGQRQGNANVVLYKIAGTVGQSCNSTNIALTGSTCAFNDVTKGNISVPCAGKSPNCSSTTTGTNGVLVDPAHATTPAWTTGPAYDLATGLGSVNVANLATAWTAAVGTFRGSLTALSARVGGTPVTTINVAHGATVSFTATVTPATGTGSPGGDISIIGTPASGSVGVDAATLSPGTNLGTATFSTTFLPGGSYTVDAHYAGDGTFSPSDSSPGISVVVSPEASHVVPTLVTFDSLGNGLCNPSGTSLPYGTAYILRVDINTTGTPCVDITGKTTPTGQVTLKDAGVALDGSPLANGIFTLNSLGFFEDQPIQLPGGSHSVVASYAGDASYNANVSAAYSITITKAATQTTVVPSLTTAVSGTSITITATIATQSNGAGPTGSVTFSKAGTALSNGTVTLVPTAATSTSPAFATATLTTTASALSVPQLTTPRNPTFPAFRLILLMISACLFWLTTKSRKLTRQKYVYASLILAAFLGLGIAACGGGSTSAPASVPQTKSVTFSVQYPGDGNYTSSSGQTTVTIQ